VIVLDFILLLIATVLAVPVVVLLVEVLASLLARGKRSKAVDVAQRPTVAVIVPAHDEAQILPQTIEALKCQLIEGDQLIVVADNCSDETAAVARETGAAVIERQHETRVGKGFALDAGMRHLEASDTTPAVVIFNDADVIAAPGSIDRLAKQVIATGKPAQGCYLMHAPTGAAASDLISRFALAVKNRVRPLGLWQLGLDCPLFGSGMAFPAKLAREMPLASGDLVEDMRLGLHLCLSGQGARFCPGARFDGELPTNEHDAAQQRRRWEHGHLRVLFATPRLIGRGILTANPRMIASGLDHAVQPLTILTGLVLLVVAATSLRQLVWTSSPLTVTTLLIATGSAVVLVLSMGLAWLAHLRREIPLSALLGLPAYLLRRISNQVGFLFRRQHNWVRTPRAHERDGRLLPIDPAAPPTE
jgi:cellulose synthase/poly-beta-1,6-N-acetylglucosamine synthase-like glycosyltransferase